MNTSTYIFVFPGLFYLFCSYIPVCFQHDSFVRAKISSYKSSQFRSRKLRNSRVCMVY